MGHILLSVLENEPKPCLGALVARPPFGLSKSRVGCRTLCWGFILVGALLYIKHAEQEGVVSTPCYDAFSVVSLKIDLGSLTDDGVGCSTNEFKQNS